MRSSAKECLVGAKVNETNPFPYKIQYEDMVLYVKRYTLDPSVVEYHQDLLRKNLGRYQYPVFNHSCKSWSIPKEASNFSEILYTGKIPSRIIVVMIASEAYNGSIEKDRLTFEDFGVTSATISLAGDSKFERTINLDTANSNVLEGYHLLLEAIPKVEGGSWIDRKEYMNGAFMLAYQLSPAGTNGVGKLLNGQLKLQLLFKTALTAPVELLVIILCNYLPRCLASVTNLNLFT